LNLNLTLDDCAVTVMITESEGLLLMAHVAEDGFEIVGTWD